MNSFTIHSQELSHRHFSRTPAKIRLFECEFFILFMNVCFLFSALFRSEYKFTMNGTSRKLCACRIIMLFNILLSIQVIPIKSLCKFQLLKVLINLLSYRSYTTTIIAHNDVPITAPQTEILGPNSED